MSRSDDLQRFPPLEIVEPEIITYQEYNYVTGYEVSLIIPTRNEAGNIEPAVLRTVKPRATS